MQNFIPTPSTASTSDEITIQLPTPNSLPQLYAKEIIRANGNVKLAAERLTTADPTRTLDENPVTEAEVLEVVSSNKAILNKIGIALRAAAMLRMFNLQRAVSDALIQNLSDVEPSDIIKLYGTLTHEIMTATTHVTKIEISSDSDDADQHFEDVLSVLPPEVRRAVQRAADLLDSETISTSDRQS